MRVPRCEPPVMMPVRLPAIVDAVMFSVSAPFSVQVPADIESVTELGSTEIVAVPNGVDSGAVLLIDHDLPVTHYKRLCDAHARVLVYPHE